MSFLQTPGMNRSSIVVDLGGAGTGQFTVAAAGACKRVVAVDVSPGMLDRLQAKVISAGWSNVEVVQAGFLTYEHTGAPADVVYSRSALHHLRDFWKAIALDRVRQMMRSGGVLRLRDVVYHFDPRLAGEHLESAFTSGGDDVETDWSRAELEEHVRDEHSTFTWLLEPMLQRTGFTIETAECSQDGVFAKYVARAK